MNAPENDRIFRCFDPLDAIRSYGTYRSRQPQTREELFSYSHLILGHFTSTTFLPSILAEGLQPDLNGQRAMDDNVPSDRRSVYLCARYDRLYPRRVVEHHGGTAIAIVVSVPVRTLEPDEATISHAEREQHPSDVQLFWSLFSFGACKHPGTIPPSCFLGIFDTAGKQLE